MRDLADENGRRGRTVRIRIDNSIATTPPSFRGTERKMQYANRKYHSGTMWGGVTIGLAGMRFTGSRKY